MDGNIKVDVLDLIELVLQYGVMVFEGSDERFDAVKGSLHQLIVEMKNDSELGTLRQCGRPEINIGEEQLAYLLE